MKDRVKKLMAEASQLYVQAKGIQDEFEGKEIPADRQAEAKKLYDQAIAKYEEAEEEKKRDDLAERLYKADETQRPPTAGVDAKGAILPGAGGGNGQGGQAEETPEMKAFRLGITGQKGNVTVFSKSLEKKALQANISDQGGFLVAPEQFVANLIQAVKDLLWMEQNATVYTVTTAANLGIPSLDTDLNDADWTSEISTPSEDTALKFGKRSLSPSQLQKLAKISRTLLRLAAIDPEGIVRDRIAYKIAVTKEKAFLQGAGAPGPLGIFTASTQGISTSRDVTATNNNKLIGDDCIKAKMTLKQQYHARPSTRWILHRDVMLTLMVEKAATTGNYLFLPGLGGGFPDRILDIPYALSEYAPNTLTTGKYVAVLGDLKGYTIANAMDLQIQVLTELFALSNETGYLATIWADGQPSLEEAFVRLKLA